MKHPHLFSVLSRQIAQVLENGYNQINPFQIGDTKEFQKVVADNEVATFESGNVHTFYATFALARDAEWACRLFVLEMKQEDEEGIGTFVNISHKSPAQVGDQVEFVSTVKSIKANEIICSFEAKVGNRLIASGETGQKILSADRLKEIRESL